MPGSSWRNAQQTWEENKVKRDKTKRELSKVALLSMLSVVLAACGNSHSSTPEKIAATVNGEAIAVHQVKPAARLATTEQAIPAPHAETVAALDSLIDQVLLAQKAATTQLERDPAVAAEISAAKQRILVDHYVEQTIPVQRVNPDAIVAFYRDNLPLFEQRQSYRLNELVATVAPKDIPAFKAKVATCHDIEELAEWLKAHHKPYLSVDSIKFSEQLPAAIQPQLAGLKQNQMLLIEEPGRPGTLSVIQMRQSQDAPLSLNEATPAIRDLLLAQMRQKFIQSQAQHLREAARIEYVGEFATAKHKLAPLPTGNPLPILRSHPQPSPRQSCPP
jgi:EpsD family peptidyl-prolyl cis-trans isomerase